MSKKITQVSKAMQGELTSQVKFVASQENIPAETVMKGIAEGTISIPANINRRPSSRRAIGQRLLIKINAYSHIRNLSRKENEKPS